MNKAVSSKFRVGIDIGGTFTDIIFIGGWVCRECWCCGGEGKGASGIEVILVIL